MYDIGATDSDLLKNFIRENALANIKLLTHVADAKIVALEGVDRLQPDWTAMIQLNGPAFRLSFRLHFCVKDAKAFASGAFGMAPADVSDEEAKDFMMECSNICTGRVKRLLSKNDIMVGMSLPQVSAGLSDMETTASRPFHVQDQWTIGSAGGQIHCSMTIDASEEFYLSDPDSINEEDVQVSVP